MKLNQLHEAISGGKVDAAMNKIISYLERALAVRMIKIPGVEHFKNSKNTGWGVRYVIDGSTRMIRFNWQSAPSAGKSNSIISVDVFDGKHDPSIHIKPEGVSLVKVLPALAGQLVKPKMGSHPVFIAKPEAALAESAILTEAKRGDFTYESALKDFLNKMSKGKSFTRSDWIGNYHISTVDAFDTLVGQFPEKLTIQGKRISAKDGVDMEVLRGAVLASCDGELEVTAGGSSEEYMPTEQEEEAQAGEKVSFSDSLEHLEGLVKALTKGSFNALFVAGKGGSISGSTSINIILSDEMKKLYDNTKIVQSRIQ